jgi:transcriptional regulator with XRE-family HTH domain
MKARRKALGMSAECIANKLGVSPATIYRYENGDIEKVPGDRLAPIADALDTTPAYLMGWEGAGTPTPEEPQHINIIKIAGRDGSFRERRLTDAQLAALNSLLDQLPDASEDL